jgi:Na+/phosphate symporter
MSLRHGARQLMDMFQADEDEAMRLLELAVARLKYNPDFAIDQIHKAQARILAIRERRTNELPAHIQKAAPPMERQIEELRRMVETQAERLDAHLEQSNVTKFRKAE